MAEDRGEGQPEVQRDFKHLKIIKEDVQEKPQDKIKRVYKKMDMYDMFSSTNRYQVLQEEPLHGADECTATAPSCHSICTSSSTAVGSTTAHWLADQTLEKNSTVTTTNDLTNDLFDFDSLDEAEKSTDIMNLDIMNVETKTKKKMKAIGKGRITIDSGAAESVIPVDMLKQVPTIPGDASKQNTIYTSADGGQMWNHGHSYVHFRSTGEQDICMADFQRTTVKKPLASVSRIVEKGNKVVFDESGGFIENLKTGKKIKIVRNNGTFAIEVEYLVEDDEPPKADFTRQW